MTVDMSLSQPTRKLIACQQGLGQSADSPEETLEILLGNWLWHRMDVIFQSIPGESGETRTFKNPSCWIRCCFHPCGFRSAIKDKEALLVVWSLTQGNPHLTYPSESFKALLLGVSVHIGPDNEPDEVKERYPCMLREEFLRKGQSNWRGDPASFHHRHEANSNGRANLVYGSSPRNYCHAAEVNKVLNWRDLGGGKHESATNHAMSHSPSPSSRRSTNGEERTLQSSCWLESARSSPWGSSAPRRPSAGGQWENGPRERWWTSRRGPSWAPGS